MTTEENLHLRNVCDKIKFPCYYDEMGQFIFDEDGKMICDIRGWGWIQKLEDAQQKQDALGKKICEMINTLQS